MITQHNVLLMEMLFLGSILMIIIATNLAWETISQDLCTPAYTATVYLAQRRCLEPVLPGSSCAKVISKYVY